MLPGFLLCVASTGAAARGDVLSAELAAAIEPLGSAEEIPVLLRLRDRVNPQAFRTGDPRTRRSRLVRALQAKAERTQRPLREFLSRRGARQVRPLWILNGIALTASKDLILELGSRAEIASIGPDTAVYVPEVSYGVSTATEWNLDAVRAPELWALGHTGQGLVVASLDTGVDPDHPDLSGRWRGGANSWLDPNGEHPSPYDADGHGTQVMGLVLGGSAGGTAIGVAPDAQWIAVKIFDDSGEASASDAHQGFQWLLDPDGDPETDDAPHVVNNSWYNEQSVGGCDTEFQTDVDVLRAAEIAVVFAAGNAGPAPATSVSPANLPGSIAVGAIDEAQGVASFSSRGPSACDASVFPELVAPGVEVRSADLTFGGLFPNSYVTVSGTSFSAPHVAGAVALLWSAFPGVSLAQLQSALEQSALDLGVAGADPDHGYGLVDVVAAHTRIAGPDCGDGFDNDGDGFSDFPEDPGCRNSSATLENPQCDDGIDNDGDGLVDFGEDPYCTAPWRKLEAPNGCGLGFELLGIFPLLWWSHRRGDRSC